MGISIGIVITVVVVLILIGWFVYDKYVQRRHQLLVNYPIIGRLRYLFEEFREPFRQYFGDEKFFESKDKLDWVYRAARDIPNYASFSPTQQLPAPKFLLKHATLVLNDNEVENDFSVTFGAEREMPFITKSVLGRSAMSDGSISPEGTRAFSKGAYLGNFPINTGEGGLTSNFLFTHQTYDEKYMTIVEGKTYQKKIKDITKKIFNGFTATELYKKMLFKKDLSSETYSYDEKLERFYRINWEAPLENFPKQVPVDMPDIIYQISSGLYGARDKHGKFDPLRYKKVMRFCKMTEIKIAQGAKQGGGKLIGKKVTPAIAYYRGVEPYKDLFSPNRFPFANSVEQLFDFIGQLQELSSKPVGIKIVISDQSNILPYAQEIKKRIKEGKGYPDFITVDGGSGGSATAPLEMMERIGLEVKNAIFLVDKTLRNLGIRDKIKIVASGKVLTPDDVLILLAVGADFLQIARGFMMSAGCIRARYCAGINGKECPVGLATQNKAKRKKYFVTRHSNFVSSYHRNLLKNVKGLLAVMGLKNIKDLNHKNLIFIDKNQNVYDDICEVFDARLKLKKDLGPIN